MENGRRKRKKKMQLSSSRRETTPENRCPAKKSIGCMSGILQLLSRHHSRRRIPPAVRKEQKIETPPKASTPGPPPPGCTEMKTVLTPKNGHTESQAGSGGGLLRRNSCDGLRSPTLPCEIRRSGGCFDPLDSPRRTPALVARLMGLVDLPPPLSVAPSAAGASLESAEEKRQKLLGALERCDQDLRELKRIIDAVRTAEILRWKVSAAHFDGRDPPAHETMPCGHLDANGEQQPSPVSVLDALSSPKFEKASSMVAARSILPVFSEDVQKKAWSSIDASSPLHRRMTIEGRIPRLPTAAAAAAENAGPIPMAAVKEIGGGRWRRRRSHAMVESVGEVEEEVVSEERNEFGRVGVELVDDVVEDLTDEFVMELADCCFSNISVHRLMSCKRKLSF